MVSILVHCAKGYKFEYKFHKITYCLYSHIIQVTIISIPQSIIYPRSGDIMDELLQKRKSSIESSSGELTNLCLPRDNSGDVYYAGDTYHGGDDGEEGSRFVLCRVDVLEIVCPDLYKLILVTLTSKPTTTYYSEQPTAIFILI